MSYYSYNPYQPDGNSMNASQRSQYGYARTPSRPTAPDMGRTSNAVTTTQWIGTIFLTLIPVIGIVCLLIWAFSDSTSPSKVNYARALLLLFLIFVIVPAIAFTVVCLIMWPTIAAWLQPIYTSVQGALAQLGTIIK